MSSGVSALALAASSQDPDELAFASASDPTGSRSDASLKAYFRELKKVISLSDVLLQVLDARDPLGSRSIATERLILSQNKRIVFILNKIDLVPQDNVLAWLKYLRNDCPTLAFKSSTQSQRDNLGQKHSASGSGALAPHQKTQTALGAQSLLQLLKNYSRNLNLKTSLTVGIFGAPNVGKSSLINSLKRARVCSVASTPGHTKVMQGVMLDKHVRLLDCPGIVFSDAGDNEDQSVVQLRNVIKVEQVQDPVLPVQAILTRVSAHMLNKLYNVDVRSTSADVFDPAFPAPQPDTQDFLLRLALQRGRLGRGGIPDTDAMARSLLHDWNTGKIPFYTVPPKLHTSALLSKDKKKDNEDKMDIGTNSIADVAAAAAASSSGERAIAEPQQTDLEQSAAIVNSFSEAFDLAGLLGQADAELFAGTGVSSSNPTPSDGKGKGKASSKAEPTASDSTQPPLSPASNGKSALGKRRRGNNADSLAPEDEVADEPAWKARQRHRAQQSTRHQQVGGSIPSIVEHDGAMANSTLSRANLKKAKKKAKRKDEIERKEGLAGPGGLLDQMELVFTLDGTEGDREGDESRDSEMMTSAEAVGVKVQQQVGEEAEMAMESSAAGTGPASSTKTKNDEDDEEW
ncbi:unnamed protein product [Tilletia controversa]|uniref:CP-type G domain-containing protein n=3 Tax=Tilletia TaxID=13289 RepID=A0A8X7MP27_9BASI|nr:hypothetical protein CF336_g6252 [Tilletia laevis]KAE8190176.1 hypothetical protein CF328_g6050 [Tilletia controversa]KAE8254149.1 hypothetical protein A4X03_0g5760 [Tilletia caries]KAE8193561.1 hypothetical protein CF335_g5557 [Tilletia laevis]KAE8242794.1 hypothetical protein A4X06_0g6758 [Tilletia controversa]